MIQQLWLIDDVKKNYTVGMNQLNPNNFYLLSIFIFNVL